MTVFLAAVLAALAAGQAAAPASPAIPRPEHVVVVVMENHGYDQIIGNPAAPYINRLAGQGATFTHSFALTHPSEPNYLALFSGSTHGVHGDPCPLTLHGPNLGHQLGNAGLSFAGYAEALPKQGSLVCDRGRYARRHVPWTNFPNVPASANRTFDQFPSSYGALPDVSFVVPDLCHDMHDCPVGTGDRWLRRHMQPYVKWAQTHDSLLVLTWDEDEGSARNRILTVFAGQPVAPGRYAERIDHYSVLRTIEDMYGLPPAGNAAGAAPVTDVWG